MNLGVPKISTCEALLSSEVTKNIFIQRAAMLECVNAALDALNEAGQIAASIKTRFPSIIVEYDRHARLAGEYAASRLDVMRFIAGPIDSQCWYLLLGESGLNAFMDATAHREWKETTAKEKVMELTLENVEAIFRKLYDSCGEMFERSIIQCFRNLSWDRPTDAPQQIGKKIILTYLLNEHGSVNHHRSEIIDKLLDVFHVLDGTSEKSSGYSTVGAIYDAQRIGEDVKNDFLQIRLFNNGNGHILFVRPDLVAAMNEIILKHYPNALPPLR
jgi:hypothetical protein